MEIQDFPWGEAAFPGIGEEAVVLQHLLDAGGGGGAGGFFGQFLRQGDEAPVVVAFPEQF